MTGTLCSNCSSTQHHKLQHDQSTRAFATPPICQYRSNQSIELLSLPAEIRMRIWRFVYSIPATYPTQNCETCGSKPNQCARVEIQHAPVRAATKSVLASLRTCRRIHEEAGHLFYSLNLLSLSSLAAMYHFLAHLAPRQRENLTSLHVSNVTPGHWTTTQVAPQAFSLLSLCPRLQDLYIDFSIDETADARLHPLIDAIFPHDITFWTRSDFATAGEYEDFIFCKGFWALSQQRNLLRLGLRARYKDTPASNPFKLNERCRPYACEDVLFKPMTDKAIELLRAQVQQTRFTPSTRYSRARELAALAKTNSASQQKLAKNTNRDLQDPIRKLSIQEAQREQEYLKQKSRIRYLFDHHVTSPCKRGDRYHF